MSASPYPEGTVRALLATELVTEATRAALLARLEPVVHEPAYFDAATYELLRTVCARIFPQPDREEPIELAIAIDKRLLEGRSDGWRYDALPPDRETYRLGLGGIQESAQAMYQQDFTGLSDQQKDAVIQAIQEARAPGAIWETLPAERFFEEMLAEMTELYYAHPLAQEEIGYVGMADVPGWSRIELGELEPREPEKNAEINR
ncbi:gluconate 2-dehydrogenase subunit 3 family protein [Hymenobacter sp. BT491]|uniref:gluconate 2-dehydrogenase subunit 3 family protein n=1 Tax=Hymenobacter sp. BT491 TaxID=2766779 RepID=UPI0016537328|nr:gluconate 2-dehydrogenase subunit 3 family protein [Hymenobacter sp. BT491]MBC6991323.1 gluconate 2-dehydrogenase subunit 3 family protein [Hymenobacter sp. BT491]